jgi:hypothetical protein
MPLQIVVTRHDSGNLDVQVNGGPIDLDGVLGILRRVEAGILVQGKVLAGPAPTPQVQPATAAEAELADLLARKHSHPR